MPSPSELERKAQEAKDNLVGVKSIEGDDDSGVVTGVAVDLTMGLGREYGDQTDPMIHAPRIQKPNKVLQPVEQLDLSEGGERPGVGRIVLGPANPPDSIPASYIREAIAKNKRHEELGEGADGGGQRFNAGKLRMDLTPPEWEVALADVTTQGSKKYAERNWEQGMKWSAMVGCMKRHINKFLAGERYDGEEFDLENGTTGCHHLAMAAWNALALMSYDLRKIGTNDLPREVQLELFDRVNGATSDMGVKVNENG